MAEQRIDAYPVDKNMGFLTCSDLRKRSSVFLSISLLFDGGEGVVINQVMIQTLFQQKTYYCTVPLINPLPKGKERKLLFQPIFKHI